MLFNLWICNGDDYAWQMEMMSDAIDETLDDDEAEEETEELTNQVLPSHHIVSYGS